MMRKSLSVAVAGFAVLSSCSSTAMPLAAAFPRFREAARNRIALTAEGRGYLAQRGRCLGLMGQGVFSTVVWPETARLSFDRDGLVVEDRESGAAVRLGDFLATSGGQLPAGLANDMEPQLTEPVPAECAQQVITVNPGFRKMPDQRRR